MLSWFFGQRKQINIYSKLYTDQGIDVLVGRISLVQVLFSIKKCKVNDFSMKLMTDNSRTIRQEFGRDIAEVLKNNEEHYEKIFIHSFSIGGGVWGMIQQVIEEVS